MKIASSVTAALAALLAACSKHETPHSTVVRPVAARKDSIEVDTLPPPPANRSSPASIVGDTFLLVAIGSQSMRVPVSDSAPCGFQPYLRLVISTDSIFYHVTDNKPTCFGPATVSASHWTGLWSTYRVNRDTLHLFQGDGDETFYWVSGILSDDSLIEFGEKPHRFVRIRPKAASRVR